MGYSFVLHLTCVSVHPPEYVSCEICVSFLLRVWTVWWSGSSDMVKMHILTSTFVPFKGCFEKVEEWLDDNKHLLGTIGMVILVVQVGVRNCSVLLYGFASLPFILFFFLLLCVSLCLFVSAVSDNKFKKNRCIHWPLCYHYLHETCVQWASRAHTWNIPWNVKGTVFCTLILDS